MGLLAQLAPASFFSGLETGSVQVPAGWDKAVHRRRGAGTTTVDAAIISTVMDS
jgi:hypothetical protein